MVVKELMTTNICYVKENALVQDAISLMKQYDIGFVPVCNEIGELRGVLTDRDLITHSHQHHQKINEIPVNKIMREEVVSLSPDMEMHQAALVFSQHALHRLPVLQGTRLVGVLSVSDLAKKKIYLAEVGEIIGAITAKKYTKNK